MSLTCDGVNKRQCDTNEDSAASRIKRHSLDLEEDHFANEAAFKGFEKVPKVLLPRFDLTPYFNTSQNCVPCAENPNANVNSEHLQQILRKCSVKLIKDDLCKITESLATRRTSCETLVSDTESSMASVKCKICSKEYSSEKKLQNHQENKHQIVYKPQNKIQKRVSFSDHVIVHEVKEYHRCRKCTRIFEDYRSLKAHMKLKHKKRKCYICNYCSKNFIDRMFFKVHIKLHCDVCGLLLPNKKKYLEHRRNVCRVLKMYKCKTCEESYFKFMDLKDHSYEHVSTYFICDICKDQFGTQCEVAHHISYLHSNKRPTSLYTMRNLGNERLYLCNFCEESSVDRDVIEKHASLLPDLTNRAMTGYKDYYFCDQCLKKFDTEMDMLQHKWTHFLKNSDNSQIRQNGILSKPKFEIKRIYKMDEKIPEHMQPKVVLEKIKVGGKILTDVVNFIDAKSFDEYNSDIKKPVVDHKSKKTIISKYQCEVRICRK